MIEEGYPYLWGLAPTIKGVFRYQYDSLVFNIGMQDRPVASQSVTHIHFHTVPINDDNLDLNDNIYHRFEKWAPIADHNPSLQNFMFRKTILEGTCRWRR